MNNGMLKKKVSGLWNNESRQALYQINCFICEKYKESVNFFHFCLVLGIFFSLVEDKTTTKKKKNCK